MTTCFHRFLPSTPSNQLQVRNGFLGLSKPSRRRATCSRQRTQRISLRFCGIAHGFADRRDSNPPHSHETTHDLHTQTWRARWVCRVQWVQQAQQVQQALQERLVRQAFRAILATQVLPGLDCHRLCVCEWIYELILLQWIATLQNYCDSTKWMQRWPTRLNVLDNLARNYVRSYPLNMRSNCCHISFFIGCFVSLTYTRVKFQIRQEI